MRDPAERMAWADAVLLPGGGDLDPAVYGEQVANDALGGSLHQHVEPTHRQLVHEVEVEPSSRLAATLGTSRLTASCYHHQTVTRLGRGLSVVATAQDRTVEGVELPAAAGFFLGVQWHPEDTSVEDPVQRALLEALVEAGRRQRSAAG